MFSKNAYVCSSVKIRGAFVQNLSSFIWEKNNVIVWRIAAKDLFKRFYFCKKF